MHTLYQLTFATGKFYIGQTIKPLRARMVAHRQAVKADSQLPVHCAWRKHGEPLIEVIGTFKTHEELHAAEVAAIKTMNTQCPNGYNVTIGGDTAPSKNPEVAAKIAAKAIGRKYSNPERFVEVAKNLWQDPEYRSRVSAGLKAGWTPERRAAAAERMRARQAAKSPEERRLSDNAKAKLRGRVVSDEARARMRASALGKVVSQETRVKMSAANSKPRAPMTEERKRNISDGVKAAWSDPLRNDRLMAARKAAGETRRAKKSPSLASSCQAFAPAVDSVGALS